MERRKFIIGASTLATGGAAAFGTGAFSSAEAERSVSVEVADDADAYLAIEATSQYADDSGQAIELDFGSVVEDGDGNDLGEHVGNDSTYRFGAKRRDPETQVFNVRNQGTNDVNLTPPVQIETFDSNGNNVQSLNSPPDSGYEDYEMLIALLSGLGRPVELSPGEDVGYQVLIDTGDNPPSKIEDITFEINANKD